MHHDDAPVGRILTRREALLLLGASGLSIAGCPLDGGSLLSLTGASGGRDTDGHVALTGTCVVRPEVTEGPYFVDELLDRADIRVDPSDNSIQDGKLLTLQFNVSELISGGCTPLAGAQVDVWHCNADGLYSDESANNTVGQKFLRGYQITDDDGVARFTTIYPGWYSGRTAHIHFKIRTYSGTRQVSEFTSQLFFNDALTDAVYGSAPYNTRGTRDTRNGNDNIYDSDLLLDVAADGDGYATTFNLALDLS